MTRMKLTENFNIEEFEGRSGQIPDDLLPNVKELAKNVQVLRDFLGVPIQVISGYRSPTYNKSIGGAQKSQHMVAKASDLKVAGFTPLQVKEAIEKLIKEGKMKKGGVGLYTTFTHYDVRGFNARWAGSGVKDDRPKETASNDGDEEKTEVVT